MLLSYYVTIINITILCILYFNSGNSKMIDIIIHIDK